MYSNVSYNGTTGQLLRGSQNVLKLTFVKFKFEIINPKFQVKLGVNLSWSSF